LRAWNTIPPQRPIKFSSFIGRITRNLSFDKYENRNAKKRGGGETALLLSELELCVPSKQRVEDEVEANDLGKLIDDFLSTLRQEDRLFFVGRYWHTHSVTNIANRFNVGESKVKVSLHRTRNKLKNYLEKKGITV
jgi:RNA polymerase sigma-70 factor (ECF subfamily)